MKHQTNLRSQLLKTNMKLSLFPIPILCLIAVEHAAGALTIAISVPQSGEDLALTEGDGPFARSIEERARTMRVEERSTSNAVEIRR